MKKDASIVSLPTGEAPRFETWKQYPQDAAYDVSSVSCPIDLHIDLRQSFDISVICGLSISLSLNETLSRKSPSDKTVSSYKMLVAGYA